MSHDVPDRRERAAWLRLAFTPGLGPVAAGRLLSVFGLPEHVFDASESALREWVPAAVARALKAGERVDDARAQAVQRGLQWLDACDHHHLLTLADADYPVRLLDLHDPPALLFLAGRRDALSRPMIAIIGARHGTAFGCARAQAFAQTLGEAGWTIVSGLALGIDGAAHQGALDAPAATVALMGTGPDRIYPASHRRLAAQIVEHGALVTELAPGEPPLQHHFPRRNRLIAALASGVLVIEAARQSGSLITARVAADLGREVFAIPGSIDSPLARGCHELIRQGAKLVESAQDVLEELRSPAGPLAAPPAGEQAPASAVLPMAGTPGPGDPSSVALGSSESKVRQALGWDPVDLDTLAERTGMQPGALLAALAGLELDGLVDRPDSGRWRRVDRA